MMHTPNCSVASATAALLLLLTCMDVESADTSASHSAALPASDRDQVQRGTRIYHQYCVGCHSEGLVGGAGPPLKGAAFVGQWQGKPLRSLYGRVLMTMPASDPGSLSPEQARDVVSYILSENSFQSVGAGLSSELWS